MPLPNLYGNTNRAAIAKVDPRDGYMNPGYDQYDDPYRIEAAVMPDIPGISGGGDPWPTTNSGFGGVGTDPSVGSPGPGAGSPWDTPGGNGSFMPNNEGFKMPDWLSNIIGGGEGGGGGMTPQQIAYLAATTGMAGKQWNDAGKIEDRFNEVADQADYLHPDRMRYAGQLAGLMADPSSIEKNPAYQFRLNQGLNALGPQQAAKGGGYGNAQKSMIDYAGNAASQEYDNEVKRLSGLAGFQFDQGRTAADLRTAGLTGSIASQNAALGTLGFGLQNAFGSQPGGGGSNRNGGGGGGGSGINTRDIVNGVLSGDKAAGIGQTILQGGAGAAKILGDLINQGVKTITLPDGSQIDVNAAARMGGGEYGPGGYAPYPTPEGYGGEGYYPPGGDFDPGYTGADYYPDYQMDDFNLDFSYANTGF
jgi:hypothetical protein